jgi:hypothetical protein
MSINKNLALSLLLAITYCSCLHSSKASAKPTEADIKKAMREQLEKEIKKLEGLLQAHIDYFKDCREACDTLTPEEHAYGASLHQQLDTAKKAYAALNEQSGTTK